jgi:hypothetical protein
MQLSGVASHRGFGETQKFTHPPCPCVRLRGFGIDLAYLEVLGERSDHELKTNLGALAALRCADWPAAQMLRSRGGTGQAPGAE